MSRRVGDRHTEARCLQYLGRGLYLRSDYAPAIESVAASIRIREETGDRAGLGGSLNLMGNIHLRLCDYAQALTCHARGLEARERAGDGYGIAESLINVGRVYLDMGDCAQALEVSRRAAEMGAVLVVSEIETGALANMGDAHAKSGRWAEALDYYDRVLVIARRTGDRDLASEILCLMGMALTERGELEAARERLAEAHTLAHSIGARRIALQSAQGLSEVCKRLGDYAAALGHHEAAHRLEKEVSREKGDRRGGILVIQMQVDHHRREAAALAEANAALRYANDALAEANARLESLATTDPLTGLPNHRALIAALDAETARCRREGGPCALLFLDIDFFKSVNDAHGHPAGDAVLCEFAETVRACLREVDTLGRWGGEEFLALLPGTDAPGALRVGERVRAAVAAHPPAVGPGMPMTCSVGVAACPPQEAFRDALVEAADQALYAAKRLGRNQVRLYGDPAAQSLAAPLSPDEAGRASRPKRRPPGG